MSFKRQRKLLKCYAIVICAWIVVFFAIQFALFDFFPFSLFGRPLALDRSQLQMLMLPKNCSDTLADPLLSILSPNENFVHFYHLPKRMYLQYNEVSNTTLGIKRSYVAIDSNGAIAYRGGLLLATSLNR